MEIALVFGGVLISLVIQLLKKRLALTSTGVMVTVVVLSLLGGVAYRYLLSYGLWESFIAVITSAGAFYAFILKNISDVATTKEVEAA